MSSGALAMTQTVTLTRVGLPRHHLCVQNHIFLKKVVTRSTSWKRLWQTIRIANATMKQDVFEKPTHVLRWASMSWPSNPQLSLEHTLNGGLPQKGRFRIICLRIIVLASWGARPLEACMGGRMGTGGACNYTKCWNVGSLLVLRWSSLLENHMLLFEIYKPL